MLDTTYTLAPLGRVVDSIGKLAQELDMKNAVQAVIPALAAIDLIVNCMKKNPLMSRARRRCARLALRAHGLGLQ